MVFKLFYNVRYHEITPFLSSVKELNFDNCDIWIDVDNKKLLLYTNNGNTDVNFNGYDELLDMIAELGKDMIANDLIDALNHAINDLTSYRSYYNVGMDKDVIRPLLDELEKKKKEILDSDFTAVLKLGVLKEEEFDKLIRNDAEAKKAIRKAIRKYRELCYENDDDDEPEGCDHVVPTADAVVLAVPKEKRIEIKIIVDQVGEAYRITKNYDTAYEFLKAIDEYWDKVIPSY